MRAKQHQQQLGGQVQGDAFGLGSKSGHVVLRLPSGKTVDTTTLGNLKVLRRNFPFMERLISKLDTFTPEQWRFIERAAQKYFQNRKLSNSEKRFEENTTHLSQVPLDVVEMMATPLGMSVEEFMRHFSK